MKQLYQKTWYWGHCLAIPIAQKTRKEGAGILLNSYILGCKSSCSTALSSLPTFYNFGKICTSQTLFIQFIFRCIGHLLSLLENKWCKYWIWDVMELFTLGVSVHICVTPFEQSPWWLCFSHICPLIHSHCPPGHSIALLIITIPNLPLEGIFLFPALTS